VIVGFRGWERESGRFGMLDARAKAALPRVSAAYPSGLAPHQVEAAAFLVSRFGCLLGDEMGLGKTRSALAAALLAGGRALVIAPAGVRSVWRAEIRSFAPTVSVSMPTTPSEVRADTARIVIVAYSQLAKLSGALCAARFETAILDEAQFVKNARESRRGNAPDTHRTAHAFAACRTVRRVYALSGTPLPSRPRELFNLLRITRHPLGRRFKSFAYRFCGAERTEYGFKADGCTSPDTLAANLTGWLLQRRKSDVLPELPPKRAVARKVRLSPAEMTAYRHHWFAYITERMKSGNSAWLRGHQMVKITILRQRLSELKAAAALTLAQSVEGKVVLFTSFRTTMAAMVAQMPKGSFVEYHGGLTENARAKAVQKFQNDPNVRFFVGLLEAAKTGINLTAARTAIMVDLGWVPADMKQAEDRIHRIGQTEPCKVFYLVAPDTIDDMALAILAEKRRVTRAVLEGGTWLANDVSETDITRELIARLGRVPVGSTNAQHQPGLL